MVYQPAALSRFCDRAVGLEKNLTQLHFEIEPYELQLQFLRNRKGNSMKSLMIATALIIAASSAPSFARDYPWCARTESNGFNGDCSFTSYQQCQATVSGQAGECRVNPKLAFSQQSRNSSHRTF
jgi:Protein of unknown function (DUF3551)